MPDVFPASAFRQQPLKSGWIPFAEMLACVSLVAVASRAASVSSSDPLLAPFCDQTITVDGRFTDWPETKASRLAPFAEIAGHADPPMAKVFAQHPNLIRNQTELMLAHTRDALYVGIRMADADPATNNAITPDQWHRGGDGVVVNGRDANGRSFAVLWWGVAKAGAPRVALRQGNGAWTDASRLGVESALRIEPNQGCNVEIRIPWTAIRDTELPPARLELAWEAAFSGVDRALLKQLPQEMRLHLKQHSTYNLLTGPDKLASRGYLSRPEWWGTLRFGDADAVPAALQDSPRGSGTAEWLAPRTAGPMSVDGDMADWPQTWLLSASPSSWAYVDRYRADVGVAWDETTLYLVFRYRDGEPMLNTEVAEKQMGFRGGDCVQVRLKIGGKPTNLCGWFDTKNAIPALTADGKERKQPNLLAAGAQEAFRALPGGRGYVQEIAIPFAEIAPRTPVAGDAWQTTFQLWWAGVDERFSVETSMDFAQPAPMQTRYDLPHDAYVSLGVFDQQGKLLRHLVKNDPRAAGTSVESWDGLDQWGKPIPAGTYVLKGVHHEPITLEHIMSATNPGTPPWWTVDGKGGWLSDQAAPQDAVTDGENVYIAAPYAEAGHAVIALGPDGKRIWGINPHVGCPRAVSLALIGDRLHAMFSGPELTENVRQYVDGDKTARGRAMMMCFDRHTGELAGPSVKSGAPITFTAWEYRHDIHNLWNLRLKQTFSPATYGGMHRYSNTGMCETTGALGLAAVGNRLVASLFYSNELIVLDPNTFEITKRIQLNAPAGLHGLDEHRLLAVSGKQVVRVDADSTDVTPVITAGLSAPFGVTTDRGGAIYVSDWGDSLQVKRFGPDGNHLPSVGTSGGRPWIGKWTPDAMAVPRGIAVTNKGKLWVAEDEFSPRRVSVWDTATGRLIRDYIGPANYRGWGLTTDPRNPQRIITCGAEFALDFDRQTYTPIRKMLLRRSRSDVFTPDGSLMGAFSRIVYREGKEFLVSGNRNQVVIMQRRGDEFRPVSAVSGHSALTTLDGTQKSHWDSDLRYHYLPDWYPDFFKGHAGDNHVWNDLNGDTVVQEDEVEWDDSLRRGDPYALGGMGEWGCAWGIGFGPGWEVYMPGFCRDATVVYRLDPVFSAEGLPQYSLARCRPFVVHHQGDSKLRIQNVYATASGNVMVTYYNDVNREFFADKSIVCYDQEGNERWSIAGPNDIAPKSVYGYPNAEFSYPGLGSGVVTWVWWHNGRAFLLSDDGLYLAGLLDNDLATGPTFTRRGGETSSFAVQANDGRLFLINGANSAHHILEVKGLDTSQRFEQELVITDADVAAAARALAGGAPAERLPSPLLVTRMPTPTTESWADGWNLDKDGARLTTTRKPGRGGSIVLKTDGTYLYVAAHVLDETPVVNNGENWQTPFISGDCVDVMLATKPDAEPNRRRAAAGDLRLLFTKLSGEPLTVLHRPVAPGSGKPVQMLAATIDEVKRLPSCAPTIEREKAAYTLTARVPLAEIGLPTLPGELRGDVGVIYGDATGRDRDQRLYYFNKATGIISDLTTEASLTPDKWGRIVVAKPCNLLADPGFEGALGTGPLHGDSTGWTVGKSQNGAIARVNADTPFVGKQALVLEQTQPVTFPANATAFRDRGELYEALNDGKGGGFVLVDQRIPVTGGQQYDLRFFYRTADLAREFPHGRPGYAIFAVWVFWGNEKGGVGHVWALRCDADSDQWLQELNPRAHHTQITGLPYTAPPEATHAQIRFQLAVNYPTQPVVCIDQVEFTPTDPSAAGDK